MRRLTTRQRTAALTLTLVCLVFISLDFTAGSLRGARGGTRGALGSLYRGTDSVLGPTRRFIQGIPDVGRNRHEIAVLENHNAELQRQLNALQADQASLVQLKQLQLLATAANVPTLPARVLATGPGAGFSWTVTVDVGAKDSVVAGQTVTDGHGLVGRVLSVQPNTSEVLLLSDPAAAIGVRDTRSGSLLLASGVGARGLTGSSLAVGADVKIGDTLVSGPAGQTTFAPGIAVGTVSAVSTDVTGLITVAVRLSASQTGLNLLGIMLPSAPTGPRLPLTPAVAG